MLKKAGRWSGYLIPLIIIASTAIANEPDMAQAAGHWKNRISGSLDDGMKQLLAQIVGTSKEGWIAKDQKELERVIWIFHREIGVLRGAFADIAKMVDDVASSYRSYWEKIGTMVISAIMLIIVAKRMQLVPQARPWGMLLEKSVATAATGTTAIFTKTLASILTAGNGVLTNAIKKDHQFHHIMPNGEAKVNFREATLDSSKYPSFQSPPAPNQLPKGHERFDWIEP
ncbi:hypothetical protein [Streptosporangium sp. NPDC000396]|uniref:hypothetical protein n=1 Tax=Streptosporangium sp. NPDC000396 TaxID=3366185 RepID=UPI0036AFEC77